MKYKAKRVIIVIMNNRLNYFLDYGLVETMFLSRQVKS